jgi:hypothetical protein
VTVGDGLWRAADRVRAFCVLLMPLADRGRKEPARAIDPAGPKFIFLDYIVEVYKTCIYI